MQNEYLGNGQETAAGGLIERRGACLVADVDAGAFGRQQTGELFVAAVHGEMQRRGAGIVGRAYVGVVGQEQVHHRNIVLDAGVGERLGPALGMPDLDVGAMLQKVEGDFAIAAPGHIVQCGGAHLVA